MPDANQTNEIWQQISGAHQLWEIYDYFPTLHDATVENISIRFELREITATFRYHDLIEKAGAAIENQDSITTRFQMRWRGVEQAALDLSGMDVIKVSFRRNADLIETRFEDYAFGFGGFILARSIQILGVEQISVTNE